MKRIIFLCLFFFVVLLGCGINSREHALQQKEELLRQKEEALILRESDLQKREEELALRLKELDTPLDSTHTDTTARIDPNLLGGWNVEMTCTQTTCPGSAVGDTKNERWQISWDSTHIVSKAIVGDNVTRVYRGLYTGNTLELVEGMESTTAEPATKMVVRLTMTDSTTMEGQREIIREGDCRILYNVKMNKR